MSKGTTVIAILLGTVTAYACYSEFGGRYFYFEHGNIRRAKFDHLTGKLEYLNPGKIIRVRYDAKSSLWSGLSPENEILVKSDTGEAVLVSGKNGQQLVVNGIHKFFKKRDEIDPSLECWVSEIDPSLTIRPSENLYSWEKVSVQASLQYGQEEDGWVTVEAP